MTETNPLDVLVPGTHHKAFVVGAVGEHDGVGIASVYFDLTEDQVRWAISFGKENAAAMIAALETRNLVRQFRRGNGLRSLRAVLETVTQYWSLTNYGMTLDRHLLIVANNELRQDLEGILSAMRPSNERWTTWYTVA